MPAKNPRFLRPNLVWLGVWIAFSMLMVSIGYWQSELYWKNSIERAQKQEFRILHKVLPYALAFLEEHGQTDLIKGALDTEEDMFFVVYTDMAGNIKYPPPYSLPSAPNIPPLENYKFSYVYKTPVSLKVEAAPGDQKVSAAAPEMKNVAEPCGKLYLIAKQPLSLSKIISAPNYFQKIWASESFLSFTIIGYFLVLMGFAAICSVTAKFQSHFQSAQEEQHRSELETRDLRIQILESNLNALDLRLEILDQEYEKARSTSDRARKAIDRLVKKVQSESTRNEELGEKLGKAQLEHENAVKAIRAISEDIEKVAAEKRELENMRQAEQVEHPGYAKPNGRRPKEYLWLNLVYKNLQFSRRALQNIIDIQYVHDIFPSLPDALSAINHSTEEALRSGEGIPSRSVVRYSQPVDNFEGALWEYRFSKDGRIFFGMSQSRTWSIDTVLLKRHFSHNRYKYQKFLENTLGKDNQDIRAQLS